MIRTTLAALSLVALSTAAPAQDCDGNGLNDIAEISAQSFLDSNHNLQLDLCEGFSVDRDTISLSQGGTQTLHMELGPGFGAMIYRVIGSLAGESPGLDLGLGMHLPLNWDGAGGYMNYTLKHPYDGVLKNGAGFLDPTGSADAALEIAPNTDPALAGLTVHHAYGITMYGLDGFFWISNAVSVELVP